MFEAILFDLDGTLINTNELIISSFEYTFDFLKKPRPSRGEIIDCFGEPLDKTMRKFFKDTKEACSVYREHNLNHHDENIFLFNNAKLVVKTLKERGIKTGIVTSKSKELTLRGTKLLGIYDFFDVIITSDEVERHKPDPEPVLKACNLLEVSPSKSLMIGDSVYDIISGSKAGSKTCGVMYSFLKDKILKENADFYIEDLIEVLDIM